MCNPDNPTGYILTDGGDGCHRTVRRASGAGAWILSDEVYRGAERTVEQETPSFYGRYDRASWP